MTTFDEMYKFCSWLHSSDVCLDSLIIGVNGGEIWVAVNCNDFFGPGSDAEDISLEDISLFNECIKDCNANDYVGAGWEHLLFVARKRRRRPWKRKYERIPKEIHHLFDECSSQEYI